MPEFALVVAAAASLAGTWLGAHLGAQRDRAAAARERRSELYIDLLVEASAELDWLKGYLVRTLTDGDAAPPFPDERMDSAERRRLGARASLYATKDVVRLWNTTSGIGLRTLLGMEQPETARAKAELAFDALEKRVRIEFAEQDGRRWPPRRD